VEWWLWLRAVAVLAAIASERHSGRGPWCEVAPRRFAVQQENRRPIGGTLVDVVHSQGVSDVDVVRREGVVFETFESRFGPAEYLHSWRFRYPSASAKMFLWWPASVC